MEEIWKDLIYQGVNSQVLQPLTGRIPLSLQGLRWS